MKLYLLLFLAISTQLSAQSCFKIRHINIVNVKTGAIEYDQAVLIKGHRIDLIANDEADTRKLSANDIDGTNKYLIPGLWDMHAHDIGGAELTKKFIIPVMLANGVTGLRNMWGSKDAVALRDSISKDLIVAPRMVVGTPLVNGPNPFFQGTVTIKNVSSIQRLVDSLKNMGYDFVKVYSFLRHDLFFSLANYCKEKHIPFEGHVPIGVTAEQASNAGMESIEHLFGIRKSCSTQGLNSTGEWENQMLDTAVSPFEVLVKSESSALPFDTIKAKKLAATLVANHTAVVPTLVACVGYTRNRDSLVKTADMIYIPEAFKQYWYGERGMMSFDKNMLQNLVQMLGLLHKQGVMILAGTDCENPYVVPGFSLHDELEWYVKAGLTPLEALQTATINPAIFFKKDKELGTVTKGKLADLVILDRNPLTDIKNARTISAVIVNGHLIDKNQIDQELHQLKQRAASK